MVFELQPRGRSKQLKPGQQLSVSPENSDLPLLQNKPYRHRSWKRPWGPSNLILLWGTARPVVTDNLPNSHVVGDKERERERAEFWLLFWSLFPYAW